VIIQLTTKVFFKIAQGQVCGSVFLAPCPMPQEETCLLLFQKAQMHVLPLCCCCCYSCFCCCCCNCCCCLLTGHFNYCCLHSPCLPPVKFSMKLVCIIILQSSFVSMPTAFRQHLEKLSASVA